MATKKKSKPAKAKAKVKKSKPVSRKASNKRITKKRASKNAKKPIAKKKSAQRAKKAAPLAKKASAPARATKSSAPRGRRETAGFEEKDTQARTSTLSGDLQGLRDVEDADSESVDELLEEGNALEASVVSGVEEADDNEEREVHTHEVPEDDVPEEYLDQD